MALYTRGVVFRIYQGSGPRGEGGHFFVGGGGGGISGSAANIDVLTSKD